MASRLPPHNAEMCYCTCHDDEQVQRQVRPAGAKRRDPVEAAVACPRCQNLHTLALLDPA